MTVPPRRDDAEYIIETRGLSKQFGKFIAVNNVDLKVRRGTIHSLIGPNGAGKTTLFNLLTRFLPPSAGRILYKGEDITSTRPSDLPKRGIGRSFQISAVFPHLTVMENVRIALQRAEGISFHFWRPARSLRAVAAEAMALLATLGLEVYGAQRAAELPYGRKRVLELATTLALKPEILLLDEPTAGLGHEDVARITALIAEVAKGRSVLMVEHNLGVVADLSHTITVLQRGEILTEGPYETVSRDPEVIEAYMGMGHA